MADYGIYLFGLNVWDRGHVAEVPVVSRYAVVDGIVEREVGMMADLVESIDQRRAGRSSFGCFPVADGTTVLERFFAIVYSQSFSGF